MMVKRGGRGIEELPMTIRITQGDALSALRMMDGESVDSIVTDPPYGLSKEPDMAEVLTHWLRGDDYVHSGSGFMGKKWDSFVPGPSVWRECLRVLKPGGHLLCFAGTRTVDLMGISIRLAGFEIRDQMQWLYGTGFPKSMDVSKAIDKAAGVEREVISEGSPVKRMIPGADQDKTGSWIKDNGRVFVPSVTAPGTDEAKLWEGWGTALKPGHEPIIVARKPLIVTVAANVLAHGVGGINIDGCRVGYQNEGDKRLETRGVHVGKAYQHPGGDAFKKEVNRVAAVNHQGRWPANVILTHSDDCVETGSREVKGDSRSGIEIGGKRGNGFFDVGADSGDPEPNADVYGNETIYECVGDCPIKVLDGQSGGASRFFYTSKASTKERGAGLEGKNVHPTVKPIDLMRYLVRLVTPPNGLVLDPFLGSGTTAIASRLEGFDCIGVEMDADYCDIATARIKHWCEVDVELLVHEPTVEIPDPQAECNEDPPCDWEKPVDLPLRNFE